MFKERLIKPIITQFLPEPNGYLHISYAKAIAVNFGFTRFYSRNYYLYYDNINPEKEEEKYFMAIFDMIWWLGFELFKIIYSSDNFGKLYEPVEKLIGLDKVYVCYYNGEKDILYIFSIALC